MILTMSKIQPTLWCLFTSEFSDKQAGKPKEEEYEEGEEREEENEEEEGKKE